MLLPVPSPPGVAVGCWGPLVTNWRVLGAARPRGTGALRQLLAGRCLLSAGAVPGPDVLCDVS